MSNYALMKKAMRLAMVPSSPIDWTVVDNWFVSDSLVKVKSNDVGTGILVLCWILVFPSLPRVVNWI